MLLKITKVKKTTPRILYVKENSVLRTKYVSAQSTPQKSIQHKHIRVVPHLLICFKKLLAQALYIIIRVLVKVMLGKDLLSRTDQKFTSVQFIFIQ